MAVENIYSLVLRTYPSRFREAHGEEILGTLAEKRAAGERVHHLRQLASLLYDAARQRWLHSTNGSVVATVRQGLAWGVLALVARQAGLALYDLVMPLIHHWPQPFQLSHVLLAVGWILSFCLLALGRRQWGLTVLTVTMAGFVFHSVELALSYGGRFSLPFTLHYFLPALLPLLAAYAWPAKGVKLSVWTWLPILAVAAAIPSISMLPYQAQALVLWAFLVTLALSFADPRLAVATVLVLAVFGGQKLIAILGGSDLALDAGELLVLWILLPILAVVLAARSRPRVLR